MPSIFILALVIGLLSHDLNAQSFPNLELDAYLDDDEYQKAIKLCDSVLSMKSYQDDWFYYFTKKADALYYLGDIRNSLKNYLLSLEQESIYNLENQKALQETYSYTGFCYTEFGLHQKAFELYQKSLELSIEMDDSVEVAIAYYNLSNSLLKQGKLDSSMNYLNRAYDIDVARKDTSAIGFDLNAMGYALLVSNEPRNAIQYFKESIDLLNSSTGNKNSLGTRYNNLAKAYLELSAWDSAQYFTQLSIDIHQSLKDSLNLVERWINMAAINNQLGNHDKAIEWGEKTRDYFDNGQQVVDANYELIKAFIALHSYEQALQLAEESIEHSRSLGLLLQHHRSLQQKASILAKLGSYKSALLTYQEANGLSDSIQSVKKNQVLKEMEVKYEVDKIESENELLHLENRVNEAELARRETLVRWLTISILIITCASIIITIVLVSRNRIKSRLLQTEVNELRLRIKGLLEFNPEEVGIVKEQINKTLQTPLSDREFHILNLALSDKNNSEIAEELFVSTNTVKFHLKNVYQKLGVADRKEALKYAVHSTKVFVD